MPPFSDERRQTEEEEEDGDGFISRGGQIDPETGVMILTMKQAELIW